MSTWPPTSNTSVANITLSYLYRQYADDADLQSLVDGYNAYAQAYLDYLNGLELPIYTGAPIAGTLLDWVAVGLYGYPRPGLPSLGTPAIGPYNTFLFNAIPYDGNTLGTDGTYTYTTDDVYKRCLTWAFYKGDGRTFTMRWLKRRINRFLNGLNGTDVTNDQTYKISVEPTGKRAYTITVATTPISSIFAAAVAAGVLELPFQIAWTVNLT
jgi:hypothetical protein